MAVVASYIFALHNLGYTVREARVIATTVLVIAGLFLVYGIEEGRPQTRRTAVGTMCFVLLGPYAMAILLPSTRDFFALVVPGPGMIITAAGWRLTGRRRRYSWLGSRRLTTRTRARARSSARRAGEFSSSAPRLMLRLSPLGAHPGGDDPDHLRRISDSAQAEKILARRYVPSASAASRSQSSRPSHSPSPIRITGKWRIVPVWISVSASNSSSSVPKPPGSDHERAGVAHEHHLAREEVAEAERDVEVVVGRLLVGQLDVAADRDRAGLARARLAASISPAPPPVITA